MATHRRLDRRRDDLYGVGRRCGVGRGRGVTLGVALGVGLAPHDCAQLVTARIGQGNVKVAVLFRS
jgi:hypothetical protein